MFKEVGGKANVQRQTSYFPGAKKLGEPENSFISSMRAKEAGEKEGTHLGGRQFA